jgi:uncharacterized protein (UPF0276 family)
VEAAVVAAEDVVEAVVAAVAVVVAGAETMNTFTDKVGLGWRSDLAAEIFNHLDGIDLLEIIADDFFDSPRREIRALQTLSSQVSVVLHGVGMGLASAAAVETMRLENMARLVGQIRPQFWSEHLAFVRGGGLEIGHLAAPPRTADTVEGAAENLYRAALLVGSNPLVENIATLIEPPGSTLSESAWINGILASANCHLLLDLHNVYANGLNHGYDPKAFLHQIPAHCIAAIHIAGGKIVSAPDGSQRVLDDHLHDVPDPVFDLLEEAAALSPNSLTVILERDGAYPSMDCLLAQIELARRALARGRGRQQVSRAALEEVSA